MSLSHSFKQKVRTRVKNILLDELYSKNLFPGQMTDAQDIKHCIAQLRPVETDKKLIRLGPHGDGGYLVPDDLEDLQLLISPGVDKESAFEYQCAEKGMEVHLIDASVSGPALDHPKFNFHPYFLGTGVNELTLEKFIYQNQLDQIQGDWILQMDIEGAEWETLIQLPSEILQRFRIMIIEFHDLDNLFNKPFFDLAKKMFDKILNTHQVVHLHPNNAFKSKEVLGIEIPRYMEFTFLRKDRIQTQKAATNFPHPLDSDCTVNQTYPLPEIWYRH
jgi:hypothetical protein